MRAGLSKLPNARRFNLGKYPAGNLRQRFPPAGLGFDGRPVLSEQGFHLLSSLLEMCPVSCVLLGSSSVRPVCRGWAAIFRTWQQRKWWPASLGARRAQQAAAQRPQSITVSPALPHPGCHYLQERRITCEEALNHPWFREQPLPKDKALMPTFPGG